LGKEVTDRVSRCNKKKNILKLESERRKKAELPREGGNRSREKHETRCPGRNYVRVYFCEKRKLRRKKTRLIQVGEYP